MKKISPEVKRGRDAEKRFIALARSLKGSTPWVQKVRQSGTKLDYAGVDISIYIRPLVREGLIKVPIQIKSSLTGVVLYMDQHPECIKAGVIVVIVNEGRSDDEIREWLKARLEYIRNMGKKFDGFYNEIENRFVTSPLRNYRPKSRTEWKQKTLAQVSVQERLQEVIMVRQF